jgi:Family of unknown function (DUF6364)
MPLVNKKKVTIGLTEDVMKWGKIQAIKNNTSLSMMFEDYLKEQMNKEKNLKAAQ